MDVKDFLFGCEKLNTQPFVFLDIDQAPELSREFKDFHETVLQICEEYVWDQTQECVIIAENANPDHEIQSYNPPDRAMIRQWYLENCVYFGVKPLFNRKRERQIHASEIANVVKSYECFEEHATLKQKFEIVCNVLLSEEE